MKVVDLQNQELSNFGIVLHRLRHEDIELVRTWRNSPQVMNFMAFREEISPSMQEGWFASLDPQRGFYYLIECGGTLVGLVNLKNVDRESGTGEGGIFIADERFQNSMVAFQAILTIYDFGFDVLGLTEITAHILDNNRRAIRLNEALGFKKDPGQEGVMNPLWRLTSSEYRTRTVRIRSHFKNHHR